MSSDSSPIAHRVVFAAPERVEIERVELPEPRADEVRVGGVISLISPGTELALLHRLHPGFEIPGFNWARYPFKAGYSLAGRVERGGGGFEVGARVFASTAHSTRANVHRDFVVPLPEGLSDRDAAFVWLAKIAWTALLQAPPRPGESAVVIGLGLVGNLAAQCLRLAGARVVATDRSARRRELAAACGIEVLEPAAFDPFQDPIDMAEAGRPTLVVDAVGSEATIPWSLNTAAPRGRVVLLGAPRKPLLINPYLHIMRKGLAWIGAHEMHGNGPALPETLDRILRALADRSLVVDPLVRAVVPMTRAVEAYAQLDADPEGPPALLLDLTQ